MVDQENASAADLMARVGRTIEDLLARRISAREAMSVVRDLDAHLKVIERELAAVKSGRAAQGERGRLARFLGSDSTAR